MKTSVIEEMLHGALQYQWETADQSEESKEAREEYRKRSDISNELLSPEHSKEWDDYFLDEGGMSHFEKLHAFRMGARFGLLFALETLEEDLR